MIELFNGMLFHDIATSIDEIDRIRLQNESPDYKLIKSTPILINTDKGIPDIPDGRIDFVCNGLVFESFFKRGSENKLFVFLNGAITETMPEFKRWSYYNLVSGTILNIADPMYRLFDGLKLGWYYGDENTDFRKNLVELVKRCLSYLKITNSEVFFFGSSGGGAASIECASLLVGSVSIAINPQIVLKEYYYAEEFSNITRIDLHSDKWKRNDLRYFISRDSASTLVLFFNAKSIEDMQQANNICEKLGVELHYGVNRAGSTYIWIYDAECSPFISTHVTQENREIFLAITYFVDHIQELQDSNCINDYALLINEFWYDYWKTQKLVRRRLNFERLFFCRGSKRKIYLWGAGGCLNSLSKELFDLGGNNNYMVKGIIDSDPSKIGSKYNDSICIVNSNSITDWHDLFIIITVNSGATSVAKRLDMHGLKHEEDYIFWQELFAYV